MMLPMFIIGLELQRSRIWALCKSVFGVGGEQLVVKTGLFALMATVIISIRCGLGPSHALALLHVKRVSEFVEHLPMLISWHRLESGWLELRPENAMG